DVDPLGGRVEDQPAVPELSTGEVVPRGLGHRWDLVSELHRLRQGHADLRGEVVVLIHGRVQVVCHYYSILYRPSIGDGYRRVPGNERLKPGRLVLYRSPEPGTSSASPE